MKKVLVVIQDNKANTLTPPHACDSIAAAIRDFQTLVCDSKPTLISMHPEDFSLWHVADWFDHNEETGQLSSEWATFPMVHLANGFDFIKKDEK